MISQAIWAKNIDQNVRKHKRPPKSLKNQMFMFMDYVQLLMISQAIQAKNVDQNIKKQKRPPKSLKNQMFIFGLHSTSDDWPSNLSKKCWTKMQKNERGPLSHWKIKCSFLDYVQLLMIGRAIRAKKCWPKCKKTKKTPEVIKKSNVHSFLDYCSTSDDWSSDPSKKCRPKCKITKKAP